MRTRILLKPVFLLLALTFSLAGCRPAALPTAQLSPSAPAPALAPSVSPPAAFSARDGSIRFRHFSIEDGLSQSSVQTILQDQQEFMWFGTEDGLNRYDGYQVTVFKHDPDNSASLAKATMAPFG